MNATERSRLIARIFSRPVLEAVARRGDGMDVLRQFRKLRVAAAGDCATMADLFDAGFDEIQRSYRCEYVYKAAIANRIVFGRHSPRTSSLAVELGVDGSIVDAAVFNGTSTAYEIKTEFDCQRRLSTQTPAYLRAFDRVYVVTHPKEAHRYLSVLDERVGVLTLGTNNVLSEMRPATRDVLRIDPTVVFRMLRRQEYVDAVREHFGPQPVLPNGLIDSHFRTLFVRLTSEQAHQALVKAMRARTTDRSSVEFLRALPCSLRALGYATPLSAPQRERVLKALAAPV